MVPGSEWRELTREAFEAAAPEMDQWALQTPGIDTFCSSSFWTLPAYDAFHQECTTLFLQHPQGGVALAFQETPFMGTLLMPLEASWCLASPLLTGNTWPFIGDFAEYIKRDDRWDGLYLGGLTENSPLWDALLTHFSGYPCYRAYPSLRCQASLSGGPDGYLSRRKAKFRKNLRRALRAMREDDLQIEWQEAFEPQQAEAFFEAAMALEAKSWKGLEGNGVNEGGMYEFYKTMVPRLAARGCLRTVTIWHGDQQVAYAFGGIWGATFRGLQFSYLPEWQHRSLGNLMQWEFITQLCQAGIQTYDLGMDMPYKHQWSEILMTTHALLIKR